MAAGSAVLWDGLWYPCAGRLYGLPAFRFRAAPSGLATRRQLRAAGLCPGGQEPVAVLTWRRGRRFAWLYRLDTARPKRVATPAQLAVLGRVLADRRRCRDCGADAGYCVPRSTRRCWPCEQAANPDAAAEAVAA